MNSALVVRLMLTQQSNFTTIMAHQSKSLPTTGRGDAQRRCFSGMLLLLCCHIAVWPCSFVQNMSRSSCVCLRGKGSEVRASLNQRSCSHAQLPSKDLIVSYTFTHCEPPLRSFLAPAPDPRTRRRTQQIF